jgi:nucleoside 2-deoxyribosyltransferase
MKRDYTYLAGSMEDVSVEEMKGWRDTATEFLAINDVETLDPTRRVSFHDQVGEFLEDEVRSMNISKRIFKQDLQDIAQSTIVLADVRRSSGRGTGTSMELMYAHMKNKIIIMVADKDDKPHPFLESIYTEKFYNLEDALEAIASYYS